MMKLIQSPINITAPLLQDNFNEIYDLYCVYRILPVMQVTTMLYNSWNSLSHERITSYVCIALTTYTN